MWRRTSSGEGIGTSGKGTGSIAFLIAALNDLDVKMFDVSGAYLYAPTTEKIYTIAGIEFGEENKGKTLIIRRALYGLKSSGAAYRAFFAQSMADLGFFPSKADPDVWLRGATKKDGSAYYEYVPPTHSTVGALWLKSF